MRRNAGQQVNIYHNSDEVTDANRFPVDVEGQPNLTGAWAYAGGTSGIVTISGGRRVLSINAIATSGAGTVQINGGDIVPIPQDAALNIAPLGNLIDPTIDFVGTDSYFVEHVT